MIDFPCGYPDCQDRAVLLTGACHICYRHLCHLHLKDEFHNCGKPDRDRMDYVRARKREFARLQEVLDTLDVVSTAGSLRPGRSVNPVDLDVTKLPCGTRNIHIPIEFNDGVKWIARVRQVGITALPIIGREVIQGEVDTMKWMKETGAAPVVEVMSQVYSRGGTEYYFMTMLPGKSCGSLIWEDEAQKDKVSQTIADFAKIVIQRSERPLRGIGSLVHDPSTNTFRVGPLITPTSASPTVPHFTGPFKSSAQKWRYHLEHTMEAIKAGIVYADKAETALLVHRWIRDVIVQYLPFMVEGENAYVVHEDANGDYIMADEEGRITGLIDWEWATVGSKCEAFASPYGLVGYDRLMGGSNELSAAEIQLMEEYRRLGRMDLADCVTAGKPYTWLSVMVGSDTCWSEYKHIKALGEALGLKMEASMEEFLAVQKEKQAGMSWT